MADRTAIARVSKKHRGAGNMQHIGLGRTLEGTRIIMLITGLNLRAIHATTGEIIRTLIIDPERRYHGTGARIGGPTGTRKPRRTKPGSRFGPSSMSRNITERPWQGSNLRHTV